jgi:hypothetical protein
MGGVSGSIHRNRVALANAVLFKRAGEWRQRQNLCQPPSP